MYIHIMVIIVMCNNIRTFQEAHKKNEKKEMSWPKHHLVHARDRIERIEGISFE